MIKKMIALLIFTAASFTVNAQSIVQLSAADFAKEIKEKSNELLLDVRTPTEFSKGYIDGAENIDWKNESFKDQVSKIDHNKALYVYCLSGVRSAEAANYLKEAGFKNIYVLTGGLMKWRAASLGEVTGGAKSNGMTLKDYNDFLMNDKMVLIDFYADWCAPCKIMKPYLDKIATEQKDKMVLVRINADDHKELCKELNVSALPVLRLYKQGKLVWEETGLVSEKAILKKLK